LDGAAEGHAPGTCPRNDAERSRAGRGDTKGMRQFTDRTGNKYANGVMRTDGVKKGSHARGASLTKASARQKFGAPFYFQS